MKNQLKTPLIVLLFLCLTSTLLHAQELEIKTKRAINTNENLLSFSEEEGREIASIFASGSVHFLSPEGHVRIIVANKNGYEKIIYESLSISVSKISKLATISYKLPSGSYLLSITNLNEGKIFINKLPLSDQLHKQDVNIQSFTKGCYLAVIHDKEGRIIASSKFIIED